MIGLWRCCPWRLSNSQLAGCVPFITWNNYKGRGYWSSRECIHLNGQYTRMCTRELV